MVRTGPEGAGATPPEDAGVADAELDALVAVATG
jgi:hypothetical protein